MFVLVALFVFVLGYVLARPIIAMSWTMGAVDIPQDWRRMHRESVPRNGGLAILLPFALGCALLGVNEPLSLFALVGGGLMLFVGLVDDIFCLGPMTKLFFQVSAAVVAVVGSGVGGGSLLLSLFCVLWVVTLTNAHNFIDGIDGLLTGCAGIEGSLLALALLLNGQGEGAQMACLLASASVAFRFYNRYPARAFAGDCGSGSLGFLFGMLSLPLLADGGNAFGALSPVFLFAYPLADLCAAVIRRLLRGRSPFAADRGHIHHRLYAAGLGVPACCGVLLVVSAALGGIGVLLQAEALWGVATVLCVGTALLLTRIRRYVVENAA